MGTGVGEAEMRPIHHLFVTDEEGTRHMAEPKDTTAGFCSPIISYSIHATCPLPALYKSRAAVQFHQILYNSLVSSLRFCSSSSTFCKPCSCRSVLASDPAPCPTVQRNRR